MELSEDDRLIKLKERLAMQRQGIKLDLDLEAEIDFPQWGFRVGIPYIFCQSKYSNTQCLMITEVYKTGQDLDKKRMKDDNEVVFPYPVSEHYTNQKKKFIRATSSSTG